MENTQAISSPPGWHHPADVVQEHQQRARECLATVPDIDQFGFSGRGIVVCGGGQKLFVNAWVCIKILRRLGCTLPIQLWHLGEAEVDDQMRGLMASLAVECVDALQMVKKHPVRILNGWELKPYAITHCPFEEVLLLDSDNVAVLDPTFLFDCKEYLITGAVFWPDYGRLSRTRPAWDICEVPYRDEPEVESGQVLVNKSKIWKALWLTVHYNSYSDFYYAYVHGDKCTFQLAFHRADTPYAMPDRGIHSLSATMCQHDFAGNRIFQHRNMDKWCYDASNRKVDDFYHEDMCRAYIYELQRAWSGQVWWSEAIESSLQDLFSKLAARHYEYTRVGYDKRKLELKADRSIGDGAANCERRWNVVLADNQPSVMILGEAAPTCRLVENEDGIWRGQWYHHEKMPIELKNLDIGH